eukprot:TRINITY_DN1323_c0_g1_i2.p1 TRINITY_DN1323_c0_g1~~TRINITY_DN1323_c0_g1_i2.p1  ORF type:complete len:359 (+),score=48.13 TRINITY_DN1323_c0_g1_i2:75-1079(+)
MTEKDLTRPETFFPDTSEINRFVTLFRRTQDRTLEEQKKNYGAVLRRKFLSALNCEQIDPYFLPAMGSSTDKLITQLHELSISQTQQRKILGIAEASGAGKTHLYFSLGMSEKSEFSVVFIRLNENGYNPVSLLLRQEIKSEHNKLKPNQNEDERTKLAQAGHNKVMLFITAHVIWLLAISEALGLKSGVEQRIAWLYALRNGQGNSVVKICFELLLSAYENQKESSQRKFTDKIMHSALKRATEEFGMLLFAFDEIASSKGVAPGLFYQYLHKTNDQTDSSLINGSSSTSSQAADLFYIFRVQMELIINQFPSIFVAMSDTQFSMHDTVESVH